LSLQRIRNVFEQRAGSPRFRDPTYLRKAFHRGTMRLLFLSAVVVALAGPANAYPQKEADILSTTSYAVATAGQKNRRGADAYCAQAKATLAKKPEEAYLAAEIERCYAMVADTSGDKKAACRRYKNALDIWAKSPPPNDHPQSIASRTAIKTGMEQYRATNCAH
jgi:hypothetical protein